MKIEKKNLIGRLITLEPLSLDHLLAILDAGRDPSIWEWMTFSLASADLARSFVQRVATMPDNGTGIGFAIRCNATHTIIGGSGYWHIDRKNKKLEIGGSWLTKDRQRTGANTESKYLLLENAFENMGCKRVSFSIDTQNEKSLRAINRIGAIREGVLRKDQILHDGRERDSAIFSIIDAEWPSIKEKLGIMLQHQKA